MAIISIPSSIGGVSIPGNLLKGPLAKLFGGNSNIATYSYPRDLGSATRGHWITFSINEIIPTQYDTDKVINFLKGGVKDAKADMAGAPPNQGFYESAVTLKGAVGSTVWGGMQAANEISTQATEKTNLHLKPQKKTMKGMVALYMPDSMNFTNNASYGNVSLLDAAKSTTDALSSIKFLGIGKVAGLLSSGLDLAQGDAAKLALSTQGLAINPGQQLLFDGIDFRTYSLSFTFTPYSKEEAETVKNIIKLFKTHAAPRISDSGMFFIPPSTFNLEFYKDGKINENVAKVAESVIESIDVNYAPNGWATHTDGAPVQTTLSINFKEIELIDREKIEFKGY